MRLVAAIALACVAAACSRGTQIQWIRADDRPPSLYGGQGEGEVLEPRSVRALLYFVRTDSEGAPLSPERLGTLALEQQTNQPMAEFALRRLFSPLTVEQRDRGLRTAIPLATELLGVSIEDGVADVNLSAQFEAAGAQVLHLLRVAQVVWTLTELPEVDAVRFRIHGAHQPVIDQLGVPHDVVTRARYSRLAPRDSEGQPVAPGPGDTGVPSPAGPGP